MSSRKLKMIHFDCIMRAFEKYLDSQMMPRSLYSGEMISFTRMLGREVKKSRTEPGQIDISFGSKQDVMEQPKTEISWANLPAEEQAKCLNLEMARFKGENK